MLEKIKSLLAERLGCAEDSITMDTSFQEDLGADSLDLLDMVIDLEREYDLKEIPTEDLQQLKTVGDVVNYLKSKGIEF